MRDTIVVGGTDICREFGLTLVDEGGMDPPEPVRRYVDVPGRKDGPLDMSEALTGDVEYGQRAQKFVLAVDRLSDPDAFERIKTRLSNLLHGRRAEYSLSWDPGYTYTGRFSVADYPSHAGYGAITLVVAAEPYKSRGVQSLSVNAAGGVDVVLPSGRRRVRPTVEVSHASLIVVGGRDYALGPGTWRLGAWLHEGENAVYANTRPEYGIETLETASGSYATLSAMGRARLSAIAAGSLPLQEAVALSCLDAASLADLGDASWQELAWTDAGDDESGICKITYDWSDL